MISEADVSGDGRVDYSEFAHLWKTFLLQKHHKPVAGRLQQVRAVCAVTTVSITEDHIIVIRTHDIVYTKTYSGVFILDFPVFVALFLFLLIPSNIFAPFVFLLLPA